jgi:hypothetical protein
MHFAHLRFRICAALFGSTLLLACAGPQVAKDTPLSAIQGRGVVIVSVTHDYETGRRAKPIFFIDRNTLDARSLRSIEEVMGIPRSSDFEDIYGQVYVLDVEPGVHYVDGWQTVSGDLRVTPRTPPPRLPFEVKAGEVIYIGNLNMNHASGRSLLGIPTIAAAFAEVRDRQQIDLSIAERKAPSTKGRAQVRLLPLGPWIGTTTDVERRVDPPVYVPPPPARK